MANKTNGVDEWVRGPPPAGSAWERIAKVIYNPDEKSFLGRTPKRWVVLFAFYLVFYAVLAALFAMCMGALFMTLEDTRPTYLLSRSLIGANPGVAHRPLAISDYTVRYSTDNSSHYQPYVEQLHVFFTPYSKVSWFSAQTECVAADSYGYPDTPCFFIKVNKIIGWNPEFYNASSLPKDMPEDLVQHIHDIDEPTKQNQIWISCEDEASNGTNIEYPWGRGLPADFYPYLMLEDYISPLVAVKVTPTSHNNIITIRCRAWANNIVYNKSLKEPSGYTRFQLYIEDNESGNNTEVLT